MELRERQEELRGDAEDGEGGEEGERGGKRRCPRAGAGASREPGGTGAPGRMDGETGGNSTENGRQAPSDELGSEVIGGRKRPQRGIQGAQYDETRRRKRRRNHGAVRPYMDRASNGYTRIGAKRNAIEVGAAILTRAAAGEYEWRDAGMGPVKRQRRGDTRQEKDSARDEDKDGQ